MSSSLLLKKLHLQGKEFIKADEIKSYCSTLNLSYEKVIRYFMRMKYVIRIFRGIFYVKSWDEIKYESVKPSDFELLSKGLELKDVKHWYFGLYTALKLNNVTHEHFIIDYVITDSLYRNNPIKINNSKFKFYKLKPSLLKFGIMGDSVKYSDLEKTILDFIYLWNYNSNTKNRIIMDLSDYAKNLSESKIKDYIHWYPKSVKEIIKEIM